MWAMHDHWYPLLKVNVNWNKEDTVIIFAVNLWWWRVYQVDSTAWVGIHPALNGLGNVPLW